MTIYVPLRSPGLGHGVTLTRASDAWYRQTDDANGERWAAAGGNDVARIHSWDGTAGHIGLLLEPSRQNRCLQSAAVDQAPWANYSVPTVTPNARVAPNGSIVADDVEDDSGANIEYRIQPGMGLTNGQTYLASCFVRTITNNNGRIGVWANPAWHNDGVATVSATWKRELIPAFAASGDANERVALMPAVTTPLQSGPALLGKCSYWGVQVELGTYPTSYIPTVAAAVTRAADVCALNVASFANMINASRGHVRFAWIPAFTQSAETGSVWLLWLDANTGFRWEGNDKAFEIFCGGGRVGATAAQTFTANTTFFILDFVWDGTFAQISVVKDGTAQAGAVAVWTPPTLGATAYLGSTAAGAVAAATYSDLMVD